MKLVARTPRAWRAVAKNGDGGCAPARLASAPVVTGLLAVLGDGDRPCLRRGCDAAGPLLRPLLSFLCCTSASSAGSRNPRTLAHQEVVISGCHQIRIENRKKEENSRVAVNGTGPGRDEVHSALRGEPEAWVGRRPLAQRPVVEASLLPKVPASCKHSNITASQSEGHGSNVLLG